VVKIEVLQGDERAWFHGGHKRNFKVRLTIYWKKKIESVSKSKGEPASQWRHAQQEIREASNFLDDFRRATATEVQIWSLTHEESLVSWQPHPVERYKVNWDVIADNIQGVLKSELLYGIMKDLSYLHVALLETCQLNLLWLKLWQLYILWN
jgi:hypothetical protein